MSTEREVGYSVRNRMDDLENGPSRIALITALTQLKFAAALKSIKAILEGHNLGFIVLKGAHVGNTLYDNPIQRVYGDLDLLVRPKEFMSVIDVLHSNGYKGPLQDSKRIATERAHYCWTLLSPEGVPIEIHRDLAGYGCFPIDTDKCFGRAEVFQISRTNFYGLSPEDLLLHLCVHMTKSHFVWIERKHIEDIALLTKKRNIDWNILVERASCAKCSCGAYYALLAAKSQFGAEIPERVYQELGPRGLRKVWLDWHLDPSAFPIYKYPNQRTFEIQTRLGLMLMDRYSDWVPFLWKYSGIRFRDVLMRREVNDKSGEQVTWQCKQMSGRH